MAVRAKFYVAQCTQYANQAMSGYAEPAPRGEVLMRPVSGRDGNAEWASSTPSGEFKMTINGDAFPWFQERLGKEVSILIEDAE